MSTAVLRDMRDAGNAGPVRFSVLPPLALYVHLPWCVRKCPYCDFNSHERGGPLPEAEYLQALNRGELSSLVVPIQSPRGQAQFGS